MEFEAKAEDRHDDLSPPPRRTTSQTGTGGQVAADAHALQSVGDIQIADATVAEYANLSKFPYKDHASVNVPAGWEVISDTTIDEICNKLANKKLGLVVSDKNFGYVGKPNSGINAYLFGKKDPAGKWQHVAIAFGGTNSTGPNGEKAQLKQWGVHNLGNLTNFIPKNLKFADELVQAVVNHFPDKIKVVVTGHSKGGLEAEYSAKSNGIDGVSFNAAGAGRRTRNQAERNMNDRPNSHGTGGNKILSVRSAYDPVANGFGRTLATEKITTRSTAPDKHAQYKKHSKALGDQLYGPQRMPIGAIVPDASLLRGVYGLGEMIGSMANTVQLKKKDHGDLAEIIRTPLIPGQVFGAGPILRAAMNKAALHRAQNRLVSESNDKPRRNGLGR